MRTVDFRITHGPKVPALIDEQERVVERKSSTHKAEVVPVVLEKHPGADRLSICRVYGFTCVVASEDWAGITKAVYLPPDAVVNVTRPEFTFLAKDANSKGKAHIKAKKLRGVLSFGLLVPAPEGAEIGDDLAEQLGVEHYEPQVRQTKGKNGLVMGGEVASAPNVYHVKYDLEAGRRYAQAVMVEGEPVVVSEKCHGANARMTFVDSVMYCGSRTEWKKEFPSYEHVTVESLEPKVGRERAEEIVAKLANEPKPRNLWWKALDVTPSLRTFCEANPGVVVYGEVLGCQDLPYGLKKGETAFVAFDLMRDGSWVDPIEARQLLSQFCVPMVPLLNEVKDGVIQPIPFNFEKICEMAEGKSLIPGAANVREGIVISPWSERYDKRVGRVKLKFVGCGYLDRKEVAEPVMAEDE